MWYLFYYIHMSVYLKLGSSFPLQFRLTIISFCLQVLCCWGPPGPRILAHDGSCVSRLEARECTGARGWAHHAFRLWSFSKVCCQPTTSQIFCGGVSGWERFWVLLYPASMCWASMHWWLSSEWSLPSCSCYECSVLQNKLVKLALSITTIRTIFCID